MPASMVLRVKVPEDVEQEGRGGVEAPFVGATRHGGRGGGGRSSMSGAGGGADAVRVTERGR